MNIGSSFNNWFNRDSSSVFNRLRSSDLSSWTNSVKTADDSEESSQTAVAAVEAEEEAAAVSAEVADELDEDVAAAEASTDKRFALRDAILDQMDLSPDVRDSIQYGKVMFEVNIQISQAVASANGVEMQSVSFSLKGSMEYLNQLSGQGATDTGAASAASPVDKLMEFFSPENTAGRILDFALGFFGQSEAYKAQGDTEDSRQSFADMIGAAIQKGFDQAQGILGQVDDDTQGKIDTTHEIVFAGLDNFIKGLQSSDEDSSSGADASKKASSTSNSRSSSAYSYSYSYNYSRTSMTWAAERAAQSASELAAEDSSVSSSTQEATPVSDVEDIA